MKEEDEILCTDSFKKKVQGKCKFCCDLHGIFAEKAFVKPAVTIDNMLESDEDEIESQDKGKKTYNEAMSINSSGDLHHKDDEVAAIPSN